MGDGQGVFRKQNWSDSHWDLVSRKHSGSDRSGLSWPLGYHSIGCRTTLCQREIHIIKFLTISFLELPEIHRYRSQVANNNTSLAISRGGSELKSLAVVIHITSIDLKV